MAQSPKKKAKNFNEAFDKLNAAADGEPTIGERSPKRAPPAPPPEEDSTLDAEAAAAEAPDPLEDGAEHGKDPEAVPDWIMFPVHAKWRIPPFKQVMFIRLRAEWTDRPDLGDRTIIVWSLGDAEEKLAAKRTRGDSTRTVPEMTKAMIRAMGSLRKGEDKAELPMTMADWTGTLGPGNVDRFWNEIGSKCRTVLSNIYLRTHSLTQEETADFFVNCLTVRSAVVG